MIVMDVVLQIWGGGGGGGNLAAKIIMSTGHCITAASPGEVCGLDSYAVSCDNDGLIADACRCYESVDYENDTTCLGMKEGEYVDDVCVY